MLKGKHIILGITGGIAAYKSAMLLRLLIKRGAEVQVVMTPAAKEFITPVTLSALSGKPVISQFFTANSGEWHSHVDLGLWADLMLVAPATASTLAKMATGVADNMLVTTYLSAKAPVMVAPSMDLDMFAHPTTARNLETLRRDGVEIIEPGSGELASHLIGKGRMAEPEEIVERVEAFLVARNAGIAGKSDSDMKGQRWLITAGPTFENIDPVRFIGNYSSGKTGFDLAAEIAERGGEVLLVAGPVTIPTPESPLVKRINVRSAVEMYEVCLKEFEMCDGAIMSAAVADYRPEKCAERKIKREGEEELTLHLVRNPDIAASLGRIKGDRFLVGFALESDHELENACSKMERKNLDCIVMNSLRDGKCFNVDTNSITIINRDLARKKYSAMDKRELARLIVENIIDEQKRKKKEN